MRFLVIEDDEYKRNALFHYLREHEAIFVQSYQSAMKLLSKQSYDGLFLDLNFPRFEEDDRPISDMGMSVLQEMERKKILLPVCIFSSKVNEKASAFPAVKQSIQYHFNQDAETEVKKFIEYVQAQ